jgi:hypothetical protein
MEESYRVSDRIPNQKSKLEAVKMGNIKIQAVNFQNNLDLK